jgi:lipopolysaccharide transport system permease protein/teichoic acid transport system permease protein
MNRDGIRGAPLLRSLLRFLGGLYSRRSVIWAMAKREIRTRYAGTFAGLVWSVVHPLMMILIYWFVFSVGFKVKPAGDTPFIIVFLCGLIPWTAFSETLSASANAITGNPHLVKKAVFPTQILPVVHLTASMVSHVIMLVILAIVMLAYGMPFSVYNLQFVYFLLGMSVFCIGLGWIVAALNVFYRDVGQILTVVLNMWFWLTPIVWAEGMIPERFRIFLKLSPMFYVVHGYRASFVYHTPFWDNWRLGGYFWVVSVTVFALGGLLFRKLRPSFPEVL